MPPTDSLLDAFARRVAEIVLERLREQPGLGVPLYATPRLNPLGSRRRFLDAARAGAFNSFPRGRSVAALWADADAWMRKQGESAEGRVRPRQEAPRTLDEDLAAATRPTRRRRAA